MNTEQIKAWLADSSALSLALERSTGGYSCPLRNVAKGLGISPFELQSVVGDGLAIDRVDLWVELDGESEVLFFSDRENPMQAGKQAEHRNVREEAHGHGVEIPRPSASAARRTASRAPAECGAIPAHAGGRPAQAQSAAPGPFADRVATEDVDARSEREWDAGADLRAEFPSFEAYRAFRRAEARGLIGNIAHGHGVVHGEDARRERDPSK